jgi:phosphatidylethanolamine/phosphatidyl-N-methylethanolamine N-methyltransferase
LPESGDPSWWNWARGTGPFTMEIQRTLAGRGRHLAIEANPHLAAQLSTRCLGAEIIQADAADLPPRLAASPARTDLRREPHPAGRTEGLARPAR